MADKKEPIKVDPSELEKENETQLEEDKLQQIMTTKPNNLMLRDRRRRSNNCSIREEIRHKRKLGGESSSTLAN